MKNKNGTTDDLVEYHEDGTEKYFFKKYSDGHSTEYTYNKNGDLLIYRESGGYSCTYTYDDNGAELTFEENKC